MKISVFVTLFTILFTGLCQADTASSKDISRYDCEIKFDETSSTSFKVFAFSAESAVELVLNRIPLKQKIENNTKWLVSQLSNSLQRQSLLNATNDTMLEYIVEARKQGKEVVCTLI